MKHRTIAIFIIVFSLGINEGFSQAQSIGGFNAYFGTLHNHSSASDGMGTPREAYYYASSFSGMDFFGLADHAQWVDSLEWKETKEMADKFNKDGVFTTFRGFEWSHEFQHVAVINTEEYCTCKKAPEDTFTGFLNWVRVHDCVAFFNHPGREDVMHTEFNHFMDEPSDHFVGIELWNGRNDFSRYYYNDGYFPNDGNKSYYDEANSRGWTLGAAGSEDNHRGDHGNYTQKRLAILADTLTRSALYEALKIRRFYSTLDKSLALSFKIDGNEMGSVIDSGTYDFQVAAKDRENEIFTQVQIYKNGSLLKQWQIIETEVNILDTFDTSPGDYFYTKITQQDGNEAISSPVFIKK
jgi:predicted metal-dependent phosphoesterase TrpH